MQEPQSPNPTHAAAGAASHRRSEDKLHVYFSLFLRCVLLFLFLPRNELSGGPPPAQLDTHTDFTPSIQADAHALPYTHTHTGGCFLQAPPPPLLILPLSLLLLDVVDKIPVVAWWCAEPNTELLPPVHHAWMPILTREEQESGTAAALLVAWLWWRL